MIFFFSINFRLKSFKQFCGVFVFLHPGQNSKNNEMLTTIVPNFDHYSNRPSKRLYVHIFKVNLYLAKAG